MTTYRLFPSTSGPAVGTAYAGNLIVGCVFGVTSGGKWLTGYWWWVPGTNGDTASGQKFALWQVTAVGVGTLVPNSTVLAGALTAGAWNFVPLPAPLLLTPFATSGAFTYGCAYVAATGKVFTSGFPETKSQFAAAEPFAAGITNGPLFAFSSLTGSAPAGGSSGWSPQMPFTIAASDPAVALPGTNDTDANLWLDIEVSDTAPANPSYRCFPNEPVFNTGTGGQNLAYTLGLEFSVTQACTLSKIWHYSPPGVATILPSRCGLWNVGTQTEVPGSDNSSPSWKNTSGAAAAAGDGWISCDYSAANVTLASGTNYKVSTFTSDNTSFWFMAQANFWGGSPGPFTSGITQGPLVIPGNASATPGQDSWNQGIAWTYPNTSTNPEFDGLDVEVIPVPAAAPTGIPADQMTSSGGSLYAATWDKRFIRKRGWA